MAITQAMCNSYKQERFSGTHTSAHTYKIALYTSATSLDKTTTTYTGSTNEVANGGGYTTAGATLTGFTTGLSGDTAYIDWTTDPSWGPGATITARGALIYNDTLGGKNAVAVIDFGADKVCTNGTFTVQLPAAGATAIIRTA